jgi:Domain of unknown function (DUF5069)
MQQAEKGKDLTKVAPRSPNEMVGGYLILGRTLDKCRALLWGNIGPYHFDCPLDNMLFGWKRIVGNDFKKAVAEGRSDEEMAKWVDEHGKQRTPEEKQKWIGEVKKATLYNDPQKRELFIEETRKLGLDPATTTLFEWLDADDQASYPQAVA